MRRRLFLRPSRILAERRAIDSRVFIVDDKRKWIGRRPNRNGRRPVRFAAATVEGLFESLVSIYTEEVLSG